MAAAPRIVGRALGAGRALLPKRERHFRYPGRKNVLTNG